VRARSSGGLVDQAKFYRLAVGFLDITYKFIQAPNADGDALGSRNGLPGRVGAEQPDIEELAALEFLERNNDGVSSVARRFPSAGNDNLLGERRIVGCLPAIGLAPWARLGYFHFADPELLI
jgi:hypothetical protein